MYRTVDVLEFLENDFNRAIVRRLLDAGVDINARTDWGDTAAHYAALHGTYEVLELLCEEGINVDKRRGCKIYKYLYNIHMNVHMYTNHNIKYYLCKYSSSSFR